jgi:hypothetical protein
MDTIATSFIDNPQPLDKFKDSIAYKAKVKLLNGEELTRYEKDYITTSSFFHHGFYRLMGWSFNFKMHMKRYIVNVYGQWNEMYAFDKASVRYACGSGVSEIHEIPTK